MAKPERDQTKLRDALDEPLQQLRNLVRDGKPYAAVRDFALDIADRYAAPEGESLDCTRFLLSPKWKEAWEAERHLTWALFFPDGRDDESEALHQVFAELVRFVLDAKTDFRRREYAKGLQAALDDYLSLRGIAPASAGEGEMPALSERKYLILQTLLELGAVSADTRRTTAEVVKRAEGKAADPVQFKRAFAQLAKDGFIGTHTGRDGGAWLTTKGRKLAERPGK